MPALVPVKLLQPFRQFNAGEVAGFDEKTVRGLVNAGAAVVVKKDPASGKLVEVPLDPPKPKAAPQKSGSSCGYPGCEIDRAHSHVPTLKEYEAAGYSAETYGRFGNQRPGDVYDPTLDLDLPAAGAGATDVAPAEGGTATTPDTGNTSATDGKPPADDGKGSDEAKTKGKGRPKAEK